MKLSQKEKNNIYAKAYRLANQDKILAYQKAYRISHKDKFKAFYLTNKDKIKAKNRIYGKAYYFANKEARLNYDKKYRQEYPEKGRIKTRKREALKLGNNHEPYTDISIFERDSWICGCCGLKIDKRLKWPNLLSKSIDHIVPISKGGADAPINLQATHLLCNISKHAGSGGQLRLLS